MRNKETFFILNNEVTIMEEYPLFDLVKVRVIDSGRELLTSRKCLETERKNMLFTISLGWLGGKHA